MERFISIIIPVYNEEVTIRKCLEAALSSKYGNFEVIVVDDCSVDNSVGIIKQFPCKLIQLNKHSGASKARNRGAQHSKGEILFFTDADCLLLEETLANVNTAFKKYNDDNMVVGGTYTSLSYDNNFFGHFQSIFVNYFETKKDTLDYITTHAMAIGSGLFRNSAGFTEDFLPVLEDIEFSQRLRRIGCQLIMNPNILVRHIFNFTLIKSLKHAFRKSFYWTIYSLKNKDIFNDSGSASTELKVSVASCFLTILFIVPSFIFKNILFLIVLFPAFIFNILINRKFLKVFYSVKGLSFAVQAAFYYTTFYSFVVGIGAGLGMLRYLIKKANYRML